VFFIYPYFFLLTRFPRRISHLRTYISSGSDAVLLLHRTKLVHWVDLGDQWIIPKRPTVASTIGDGEGWGDEDHFVTLCYHPCLRPLRLRTVDLPVQPTYTNASSDNGNNEAVLPAVPLENPPIRVHRMSLLKRSNYPAL